MPSRMKSKIKKMYGLVFLLFSIVRKIYFFELVLDGLSDFTKIGSDHLQAMLAESYGIQVD